VRRRQQVGPAGRACDLGCLEIPTYTVFDCDEHRTDATPCAACGRGGTRDRRSQAIRENRTILAALGEPEADFPGDRAENGWASFAIDIEHFLAVNVLGFDACSQHVCTELGWKRKSGEVHAEVLERLGLDVVPRELREVVRRVVALAA
jgi:hypothetical protein